MTWKIMLYGLTQSALLVAGQVTLKLALMRMPDFRWSAGYALALLTNGHFAACGLCFTAASLLWMYIVRTFPFSMAYPMVSLSYAMGMVAATTVFHEEVTTTQWIGVALIILGCFLIAK